MSSNFFSFNQAPVIRAMQTKMNYLIERQSVIVGIIANANTSFYKAKDIAPPNFQELLDGDMKKVKMSVTSDMHKKGSSYSQFASYIMEDESAVDETPMGNNVILEEQALKLAETKFQYDQVTKLYKSFSELMELSLRNG